eukprot:156926_1
MGKKMHYRSQEITIQGQACCLETWHQSRNMFHNNRHSKCTHYATAMIFTGFSKDTYAEAEAGAKNAANIWIANWLTQKKKDEDARKMAEILRKQKAQQRQQLTNIQNTLTTQLTTKQRLFNDKHNILMNITRQIAIEEKEIEEFKIERNDNTTKIIITLGMTGGGKSTFCNRMFGDKSLFGNKGPCKTSGDSKSCTQENSKIVVQIGNQRISIIDTAGFGDSFGRDRQHGNRLCAYLKGCGGLNAFVLIRNGTNPRFDQSFQTMLKQYHEMFGNVFFERLIIVATRIDSRINKLQFEQNNQANVLRNDICDMFNYMDEGCDIPVVPIGLESYEESIVNLVEKIPLDKFVCQRIKSPIDGLKTRYSVVQSEENRLREQINRVKSQINEVNNSMSAL